MIGGNGGVNPSSDSQTLNVCDGGLFSFLFVRGEKRKVLPRYIDAFFHFMGGSNYGTSSAKENLLCR